LRAVLAAKRDTGSRDQELRPASIDASGTRSRRVFTLASYIGIFPTPRNRPAGRKRFILNILFRGVQAIPAVGYGFFWRSRLFGERSFKSRIPWAGIVEATRPILRDDWLRARDSGILRKRKAPRKGWGPQNQTVTPRRRAARSGRPSGSLVHHPLWKKKPERQVLVSAAASCKEPFSFLISRHPVRLFADAHMFGASHLCLWKKAAAV